MSTSSEIFNKLCTNLEQIKQITNESVYNKTFDTSSIYYWLKQVDDIGDKQKNKPLCECDFDSQIAYIVKSLDETPIETITIINYLDDKNIQKKVNKKELFLVCEKGNELIKYESDIRKSHFKHYNYSDNEMTKWHREWQECFEKTEEVIGNRRADAVVGNKILEFQYSRIKIEDVDNRTKNYKDNNYDVYWIIECYYAITVEPTNKKTYLITFDIETWKHNNFKNQTYIYLDHKGFLYRIKPSDVKSNMIEVADYKTQNEFIAYVNNNTIKWENNPIEQGVIYHNQRGAGCGKTYESIQLLQENKEFAHKEIFIYLTKMHSAKDVILKELKEQKERGALSDLIFNEQTSDTYGKQYKISYERDELYRQIIIGTIDSFSYAIGNKNVSDSDYFRGIVKSIGIGCVNTTIDGTIKYAQRNLDLNKKCLVIIDEAQDLGPEYIEAFDMIVKKTGIDVYIIGDKLQSIWGENNIYTYVEKNKLMYTKIIPSKGINQVKRFHNNKFKDFVNGIVKFNKYDLPSIEKICDKEKCEHIDKDPIIFTIPKIYNNDYNNEKVNNTIKKIINYVDEEVNKYNYLPNNFMFIFPILKGNYLANQLESRLQNYWIEKFNNNKYQKDVLIKNDYWKKKIKNNKFYKHVYLHKSEEGKSINLNDSEYSTRILSIHASKGNGCEVVFLLGMNEYSLVKFSKQKDNIMYDSLIHVAITRQKKSLYVGLEYNGDDIYSKFTKNNINIDKDPNIEPNLDNITKRIRLSNICDYFYENEKIFKKIHSKYIKQIDNKFVTPKTKIIDWGHHITRYTMFFYNIMKNIVENENISNDSIDYKSQFLTIISKISKLKIRTYLYEKYYEALKNINSERKENEVIEKIPILLFDVSENSIYKKYSDKLVQFMTSIQEKIIKSLQKNELPELCSLETAILLHMKELMDNGIYCEITAMDIYSIMYCYDECSNELQTSHSEICLCRKIFNEGNNNQNTISHEDIRKSICNHYEKIDQVNKIYDDYEKYIKNKYKKEKFTYNINKLVYLNNREIFVVWDNYQILAYSKNIVIHFIVRPQFNKLNFNEIMIDAIFNNFVLNNNDDKKYQGKKIITCIFTLDSNKPVFYEFDTENMHEEIYSYIKEYLFKKYETNHQILHDFYIYCKNNRPLDKKDKPTKNSVDHTCHKLVIYNRMPEYIIDFFKRIKKDINEAKKKNKSYKDIVNKITNKDTFVKDINDELVSSIDEYLGINMNENDVDF